MGRQSAGRDRGNRLRLHRRQHNGPRTEIVEQPGAAPFVRGDPRFCSGAPRSQSSVDHRRCGRPRATRAPSKLAAPTRRTPVGYGRTAGRWRWGDALDWYCNERLCGEEIVSKYRYSTDAKSPKSSWPSRTRGAARVWASASSKCRRAGGGDVGAAGRTRHPWDGRALGTATRRKASSEG